MLYHRMVFEPHTAYPIPAGTRYILLTFQKTGFGLDIIPETILPLLIEEGFNLGDFRKMKRYDQKAYKVPPPTPAHVPAETNKRPLEEQSGSSSKRFPTRLFITPIIRPSVALVFIARPSTILISPQSMIIPEPPVQIPPKLTTPIPVFQPPVQIQLRVTPELTTPRPPVKIPVPLEQTTPRPPVQTPVPPKLTTPRQPVQIPVTPELTTPRPPVKIPVPLEQTTPRPPVQTPVPPELTTPQPPVQIPDPPVQLFFTRSTSTICADSFTRHT
ncbi:uncharacterized protein TNCV_2368971 [Trichonephila clavipes]|nr:uncharacterized protein TNCV_2368971 [Trichonephila clavipes]